MNLRWQHGGEGTRWIHVLLVPITTDRCRLEMNFTNPAGKNHVQSRQLQVEYGENFLLEGASNVCQRNSLGTDHSTFLGMREVQSAARVLNAQVAIVFKESEVVATVSFEVDVVSKPTATAQQPP